MHYFAESHLLHGTINESKWSQVACKYRNILISTFSIWYL